MLILILFLASAFGDCESWALGLVVGIAPIATVLSWPVFVQPFLPSSLRVVGVGAQAALLLTSMSLGAKWWGYGGHPSYGWDGGDAALMAFYLAAYTVGTVSHVRLLSRVTGPWHQALERVAWGGLSLFGIGIALRFAGDVLPVPGPGMHRWSAEAFAVLALGASVVLSVVLPLVVLRRLRAASASSASPSLAFGDGDAHEPSLELSEGAIEAPPPGRGMVSATALFFWTIVPTLVVYGLLNLPNSLQLTLRCYTSDADVCYSAGTWSTGALRRALWERACDRASQETYCFDCTTACAALAQLYRTGQGVARDHSRADQLLRRACDAGSSDACYELALARDGAGDRRGALAWYDRACRREHFEGCTEACARGEAKSCRSLWAILARGFGRAELREQGKNALERACRSGVGDACSALPLPLLDLEGGQESAEGSQ